MGVGDELELDVPGSLQKFFHVHGVVTECGTRLGFGYRDGRRQRRLGMHHAHTTTATAGRRLDDDRVADVACHLDDLVGVFAQRPVGTRNAGHPGRLHGPDS